MASVRRSNTRPKHVGSHTERLLEAGRSKDAPPAVLILSTGSPPGFYQPVTPSGAWPPANPNPNFGAPRRGGGGGPSRLLPRSAHLSPSGTSIPETRSDAMVSIEVYGESISPEEITEEAGWLTSHRRRGARALAQLGLTPGHSHDQEGAGSRPTNRQPRAEKQTIRKPRLPRQRPLPKEDIKIVLRPREGLDITKISHAELRDRVLRATGLGYDEVAEDLLRINIAKNIIVASTPSMEHASKYTAVKELRYGEKSYNVTAYAAPPEDTVKGIIHDIPEYDSAEDITRSLSIRIKPRFCKHEEWAGRIRQLSSLKAPRINSYMEDNGLFPHTMIGFRPKLSTQDVTLQLRYDVIDGAHCSPLDTRAILGLDLTKAFGNVKHSAILANLGKLGLGRRVYDYISNFLADRTATLSIGGLQSDAMELGSRGTPQGSVLSPFLFNVAMIGLPKILNQIEGLQHTLYADDVTLSVPGGSEGHIQDTLQQAIEAVEQYIGPRGLSCAPQKSEPLLYRPTSRGRRTDPTPPNVTLFAGFTRSMVITSLRPSIRMIKVF
ncbi:hypothetical protein ISCGN_020654 [Ixodes scapularis]